MQTISTLEQWLIELPLYKLLTTVNQDEAIVVGVLLLFPMISVNCMVVG